MAYKNGQHDMAYCFGSVEFSRACQKAGIKPTKRQWRKWQRGIGKAQAHRKD